MSPLLPSARRHAVALAVGTALLPLATIATVAVLTPRPAAGHTPPGPTIVVAADGSGDHRSVQAAIDAVADNATVQVTILIRPGTYREAITLPASKTNVRLCGTGREPDAVVIVDNRSAGTTKPDGTTYGTSGSATATIVGNGFVAENLTIANDFDEEAHADQPGHQAVALNLSSDRARLHNVRLLGNQDTFYVKDPARVYVTQSYIEGDVDFIFGGGIAVFERSRIHTLPRGGAITAASTPADRGYGFLFTNCRFTGTATTGSTHLGRPWRPHGHVVVRESSLGRHIAATQPWTDMSGNPWTGARFFEYRNTGPGADVNANRPQLTHAQARTHTPRHYLAGTDGWNPTRP
ncbi:pectinesterase family protein [Micromonospora echinospora]|uniref:pectinesterase family protein n=1 Tax=Micromonospora echinospora TaxID=1877 RepID=UPI0033F44EB1